MEINQCVGCTRQFFTKSFLGDDAAALAPSSGEEPAHRHAIEASRRWRGGRAVNLHTDQDVDGDLHDAVIKKRREHGRDQPREVVPLRHLVVVVVALVPIDEGEGVDEDEEQHAEN